VHLVRGSLAFFAAAFVGCSGGGGGGGGSSSSASTAATSSGGSMTPAPLPAGSVATGPLITVTSPTRASFLTGTTAVVQGTIADSVAIQSCDVNGNAVTTLGPGGTFSEPVTLGEGLNVITVTATDQNGQTTQTSLGVLQGQYQPADQTILNAMGVRLNQGTFTAAQTIAQSQLTGATLAQLVLARSPLATFTVAGSTVTLVATSASFGNPTITLTPQQGYLDVQIDVPQVALGINETSSGGLVPSSTANPTCSDVSIDAQVVLTVSGGVLTTTVQSCTVTLTNFQLNASGGLATIAALLGSSVQTTVQTQLQSVIQQQLPAQINPLIASALSAPITQTILGTTATFQLVPSSIAIDPQGLSATVGANCLIAALASATPFNAPGSIVTLGSVPAHGGPTPDFFASINQDLINRVGYAAWQSGIMQMTIDGSAASPIQLPASIQLDMAFLQTFLPELNGTAAGTDAIALQIAPQLPPVFSPMPAPSNLQVAIGELQLQVVDTTTNQLVLTFVVQATVDANATINAQNTFDVTIGQQPVVVVSVASSPLVPTLDPTGVANLVGFVLPPIIQGLGSVWQGFPLPVYPGLNLNSVSIFQDGAAGDFLTVSGDVH
jgi:hypothetical protein